METPYWYRERGSYRELTEQGADEANAEISRLNASALDIAWGVVVAAKNQFGWAWRTIPYGPTMIPEALAMLGAPDERWALLRGPQELESELASAEAAARAFEKRLKDEEQQKRESAQQVAALERREAREARERLLAIGFGSVVGSLLVWKAIQSKFWSRVRGK